MTSDDEAARRRAELSEQADYHAEAMRRRQQQESVEAQRLIDRFVERAGEIGLPTQELVARPWSGRGTYRTGLVGWYLRRDQSIGVDRQGRFYVLVVPPRGRLVRRRSVDVEPSPPPLDPGKGARDGESATLETLLALRLTW